MSFVAYNGFQEKMMIAEMTGFLIRWLTNTVVLMAVVVVIPGVQVDRWETVGLAALVLGFFNAFLRPLILFLTLPLHIISLGFFTLIVNAAFFYAISKVVEGFYVKNFSSAFLGALLFSVISFVVNLFVGLKGKVHVRFSRCGGFSKASRGPVVDVEGRCDEDDKNQNGKTLLP